MQSAERLAVVAELAVVVVLNDDRIASPGPGEGGVAAARGQHGAKRELVGGSDHGGTGSFDRREVGAFVVDGNGHDVETCAGSDTAKLGKSVGLDGDDRRPPVLEGAAEQSERLSEPRTDHDPRRISAHTSGPAEVDGQRLAQLARAAGVAVAEVGVGGVSPRPATGGQPRGAGKRGEVGTAGTEVIAPRARSVGRHGVGRDGCVRTIGDGRPRTLSGGEPSLRGELGVDVHHRVASEAEVSGQVPRRRKAGAGRQATIGNCLPEAVLKGPRAAGATQLDVKIDAKSGP